MSEDHEAAAGVQDHEVKEGRYSLGGWFNDYLLQVVRTHTPGAPDEQEIMRVLKCPTSHRFDHH
ncbi:Hypothetical protein FKW44_020425 [Caligus rogercresseyi]|uniref:Uncharacterized protein n=1 Tax=Caligus rogercresseyi TaxID=217165 RepID=A0A7T8GXA0_CALRO|nr:Hypothetical protein FKW44_020425 [Caligus rogercresseyi]